LSASGLSSRIPSRRTYSEPNYNFSILLAIGWFFCTIANRKTIWRPVDLRLPSSMGV
jgi:hypothetical protein